jgi:hypothetical protein
LGQRGGGRWDGRSDGTARVSTPLSLEEGDLRRAKQFVQYWAITECMHLRSRCMTKGIPQQDAARKKPLIPQYSSGVAYAFVNIKPLQRPV